MTENNQADVESKPQCSCAERNKEAEARGRVGLVGCAQCCGIGAGIAIGPSTASGYLASLKEMPRQVTYGPQALLEPWSDIHMSFLNARYCELATRLERAIREDNLQTVNSLTKSMLRLAMTINGFYGR